ncbi:MAG TPA: phosphoglucosamine mutase [Candidatus Baltobacteraceae bacterium]|jgi:phosphoglucosamine mutase|nr:phosphoglucosamine mutase [Candidatus Baltobacteraceae bacterium]
MSRIFGTDGVRGVANTELTPQLAFAIGRAGAHVLAKSSDRHRPIIVGRDTRLSGTMLESAIVSGITSVGRDVISVGIVPTPAVARITVRTGAAAGVMISASHNPIEDNGIKFFGPDGFKLLDAVEDEIESLLDWDGFARPIGTDIGVASLGLNLGRHYYDELYAHAADLCGLHVAVDAAFGAAFQYAPYALRKLGAIVHELHCEPDGARINVNCGATDLQPLQREITRLNKEAGTNAVGVAFDGDADRALFVDETGAALSGDHVMLILAKAMRDRGELSGDTVVATVMSNIGLERALDENGIALLRAPVGDRYVLERMREGGFVLGGEQSGHIINLQNNTTGDGPMTAIALFSILVQSGKRLHELARELIVYPQILVNVRTSAKHVLEDPQVRQAVAQAQELLTGNGRLLIRPSGTEPLIRVMVEGDDQQRIETLAHSLADLIRQAASIR